jgi:hypothetical protein
LLTAELRSQVRGHSSGLRLPVWAAHSFAPAFSGLLQHTDTLIDAAFGALMLTECAYYAAHEFSSMLGRVSHRLRP